MQKLWEDENVGVFIDLHLPYITLFWRRDILADFDCSKAP